MRRCEEVGRELALLGGRLERRAAHGEELRRAVEELGKEKTVGLGKLEYTQIPTWELHSLLGLSN